ncbi:ectoine synthase [Rhizobium brockwellii]|uniref:ectoine synthase n=1 Tax=Rhizobium brockwellii TaxID=3019932 RepID=UPI003F9A359A
MIVRNIGDLKETEQFVLTEKWMSTRFIVKADSLGFSFHHTIIPKGQEVHCHYEDHAEAAYCIAGKGELLEMATGKLHTIEVGTVYAINEHDEHIIRSTEADLHFAVVFNPPLAGSERHNESRGFTPA